jgi:lysophospholipase L1-like esterase
MMRTRVWMVLLLALTACVIEKSSGQEPPLPGQAGNSTPISTPVRSPRGGALYLIGDSILVGAQSHGDLGLRLTEDQWEPEVLAEEGRSVRWAIDQVRRREAVPRYVVVVLGSNPGYSSAGFTDDVQTLRDALAARGARRIVWIPPHGSDPGRYSEKNSILRELDRTDPRLVVPDWGAVLEQHPEYIGDDGLHLTDTGYHELALFIRETLGRIG